MAKVIAVANQKEGRENFSSREPGDRAGTSGQEGCLLFLMSDKILC